MKKRLVFLLTVLCSLSVSHAQLPGGNDMQRFLSMKPLGKGKTFEPFLDGAKKDSLTMWAFRSLNSARTSDAPRILICPPDRMPCVVPGRQGCLRVVRPDTTSYYYFLRRKS